MGLGHKMSCLRMLSEEVLGALGTAGVMILACRSKRTGDYIPFTRLVTSQLGSLTLSVLLHGLPQMVLHTDPTQALPPREPDFHWKGNPQLFWRESGLIWSLLHWRLAASKLSFLLKVW